MLSIDCAQQTTTQINRALRAAAADKVPAVELLHPQARHNLGVCITEPVHLVFRGSVGYYAVSICDHVTAEIEGCAGWGVAENLMHGEVVVRGSAASAAAASLRGGRVIVAGSVGPRSGIGLKGGELIVGGDAGYMSGFMMQKGRIVICGNADAALGDSIYDGAIFLGGQAAELGNGLKQIDAEPGELDEIRALLDQFAIQPPRVFRKFVSDGSLRNFKKEAFEVWKEIL
jgi:glutamate synthase domain-containing protein 3